MAITLTIQSVAIIDSTLIITASRSDSLNLEVIAVPGTATTQTVRQMITGRVNQINSEATNLANYQVLIGQVF